MTHVASYGERSYQRKAERLDVAFLPICRQCHQEVALLPFAEDVFACSYSYDLERFVDSILLSQARCTSYLQLGPVKYVHEKIVSPSSTDLP